MRQGSASVVSVYSAPLKCLSTTLVTYTHVRVLFTTTSFIHCGKFGSLYLEKATAAARAALPIPNSACGIFVFPNKEMAANARDL